jgi:hypothetical protein
MLLLISAAVNLASNEGGAAVYGAVGALVTTGTAAELTPSHCWLAAVDGKSCAAAAVASAAIVA